MPTNPTQFATIGRLGNDPKLIQLDGTVAGGFNLAIDDDYVRNGNWVDQTVWIYSEAWGEKAKYIADKFHKGDLVYVTGQLKMAKNANGDQWHKIWIGNISLVQPASNRPVQQTPQNQERPDSPPSPPTPWGWDGFDGYDGCDPGDVPF